MHVAVEVWCVDLVDAPSPLSAELDVLSDDERARHARYLVPEPARIFATTRIALRRLLGQRLGQPAANVRITADAQGKPVVEDAPQAFFNVSHCPTRALIAFCDAAPVGVDVEMRTALAFDEPIAVSICAPAELAWMQAHAVAADGALARLWTRKEAVLKACGVGLVRPAAELDLGVPDATEGVIVVRELGRIVWRNLALTHAEFGAVALRSEPATAINVMVQPYSA